MVILLVVLAAAGGAIWWLYRRRSLTGGPVFAPPVGPGATPPAFNQTPPELGPASPGGSSSSFSSGGTLYAAGYTGACLAATAGAAAPLCAGAGKIGYVVGSKVEDLVKTGASKVASGARAVCRSIPLVGRVC